MIQVFILILTLSGNSDSSGVSVHSVELKGSEKRCNKIGQKWVKSLRTKDGFKAHGSYICAKKF